jgi:hypothetical protein
LRKDNDDFGHLFENSPRDSEEILRMTNEDEEAIKQLMQKRTLRSFRFGLNISPKMYAEDKVFHADGDVKNKREVDNIKLVPKVMKLLKPDPKKEGPQSDEDPDPRKAQEKKQKFEENMRLVDEEIKNMN